MQWIAAQPRHTQIIVTVDSQRGDLLSVEAVSKNNIPSALHIALFDHQATTWQSFGPHILQRADLPPSACLQQKQDVLVALEDLLSARLAALAELTDIDHNLSHELARLGVQIASS